jgi:voltage-gated potassium channel
VRDARVERWDRRFEIPVLIAALLVIPVIAIEESTLGDPWRAIAGVTNWLIWFVFVAEVVAMLAVVPDRSRWLRDHPLDVAIVVLTPPVLPASLQALRVLRLLRLLRLVRAAQIARRLFSLQGIRYAALLALLTALGGGAAFAYVEEDPSTWDGVWWAVTTMTTVGYGDVAIETTGGRVIAIVVMLVGIGFIALMTGAIAERFLAREVAEIEEEVAEEVETTEAVLAELRSVRERLEGLEARVQRLGREGA